MLRSLPAPPSVLLFAWKFTPFFPEDTSVSTFAPAESYASKRMATSRWITTRRPWGSTFCPLPWPRFQNTPPVSTPGFTRHSGQCGRLLDVPGLPTAEKVTSPVRACHAGPSQYEGTGLTHVTVSPG